VTKLLTIQTVTPGSLSVTPPNGCRIYASFKDGTSVALCREASRDPENVNDGWWVEWQTLFTEDDEGHPYEHLEWTGDQSQNKSYIIAMSEFHDRVRCKVLTDTFDIQRMINGDFTYVDGIPND